MVARWETVGRALWCLALGLNLKTREMVLHWGIDAHGDVWHVSVGGLVMRRGERQFGVSDWRATCNLVTHERTLLLNRLLTR